MKERILEFLRKENKTSSQFAEEIGVQPSSVSHIISGRNKPSLDFIVKMLQQYPDINTDWLIFGKGEMYKTGSTEALLWESDLQTTDAEARNKQNKAIQAEDNDIFNQTLRADNKPEARAALSDRPPSEPVTRVLFVYSDNTFRIFNAAKDS